jgi:hypothetical protein
MKKLLVAALMVVLASPAFAAIQNVKVSGDITTTFVDRNNFDLGDTVGIGQVEDRTTPTNPLEVNPVGLKRQNVFITQTRLRVDADLSDNVSTTVGLINERAWNGEHSSDGLNGDQATEGQAAANYANDTNVQLYLASVTMREFLYSPLTVTVGRQIFNYGNGLIMGDGGINNAASGNLQYIAADMTMRTSYDGIKAILDYKPLTIDMFYFKNGQSFDNGSVLGKESSSDVYGFNANYQLSDPMNTVMEAYMFSRINGDEFSAANAPLTDPLSPSTSTANAGSGFNKGNTLYVPGLRASTNPIKGLNVQGEVAWQLGNIPVANTVNGFNRQEAEHRDAMAYQLLASYTLPVLDKYKPTLNASFTSVSGDKDGSANYDAVPYKSAKTYTGWDPFNEAQGSGTIYNTMFNLTNMYILSAGAAFNPLEDVTVGATWSGLLAQQTYTNGLSPLGNYNPLVFIQPDGSTAEPLTTNKKGLGNEYDVNLTYNYTEDVTFGVSLGWFVAGDAFNKVNRDTASQALASVGVKF